MECYLAEFVARLARIPVFETAIGLNPDLNWNHLARQMKHKRRGIAEFVAVCKMKKSGDTSKAAAVKYPPKYRDPETGRTWSGRGRMPRWIQDMDRTGFLIVKKE